MSTMSTQHASAVGMIWVMDSIPWVRCASGNVFLQLPGFPFFWQLPGFPFFFDNFQVFHFSLTTSSFSNISHLCWQPDKFSPDHLGRLWGDLGPSAEHIILPQTVEQSPQLLHLNVGFPGTVAFYQALEQELTYLTRTGSTNWSEQSILTFWQGQV